jgi:hypothetical protein
MHGTSQTGHLRLLVEVLAHLNWPRSYLQVLLEVEDDHYLPSLQGISGSDIVLTLEIGDSAMCLEELDVLLELLMALRIVSRAVVQPQLLRLPLALLCALLACHADLAHVGLSLGLSHVSWLELGKSGIGYAQVPRKLAVQLFFCLASDHDRDSRLSVFVVAGLVASGLTVVQVEAFYRRASIGAQGLAVGRQAWHTEGPPGSFEFRSFNFPAPF